MMKKIGEQIKAQRMAAGMSQNDLREHLGLKSVNTIQNWEYGRVTPSIDTLNRLNQLFGWEFSVKFFTKNKK